MVNHVKIYLDYFDLGEQDLICCEVCLKQSRVDGSGMDIHHVKGRGKGKDVIENLMCLCRRCHDEAHASKYTKDQLQLMHNYYLYAHDQKQNLRKFRK